MSDIEYVAWAWELNDEVDSFFGWVVHLRDDRRAYLQYRVNRSGRCEPEDLLLSRLPAGQPRPKLNDPAVRWFRPKHVNDRLGLRQPPREGATESPEGLLELAARARFIAAAVPESDRARILAYADELEDLAHRQMKGEC